MGYNITHKLLSAVLWALLGVVLLLAGVAVMVYTPWFQNYLKNTFVSRVNASHGSVTLALDQFHIRFPLNVEISGLSVVDNADTLIAAKSFTANLRLLPLLKGEVKVNDATLTCGRYQIGSPDSSLCIVLDANHIRLTDSKVDLPSSLIDLDNVHIDGGIVDLTLKEDTVAPSDHPVVKWVINARNVQLTDFIYRMKMMPIIDSLGTHFDNALVQDVAVRLPQQTVSAKRFLGTNLDATYIIPPLDTPSSQPNATASDEANLWTVTVDSVNFHNAKAVYATRGVTPSPGLDFSYIAADSLDIGVSSFYNRATVTRIPITMFSATERCGITLSATGLITVDSEKVTLDGFDVTTASSSALQFNAVIGIGDLLKTPTLPLAVTGEGSVSLSDLQSAFPELKPFFVGIPPTDLVAINADCSGSLANMAVNNLSLSLANRVNAVFKGQMGNLTDYARLYGNLAIKGEIANGDWLKDSFLDQASADAVTIPPLRLDGNVKMANGVIDGTVVATAHTGQLALDAKWNSRSEGYDANLSFTEFPMDAFMPLLGVSAVTGSIIVNGQGYDPFVETTSLHTIAELQQVQYRDYLHSDISATVMVEGGNAEIWVKSANNDACFNMVANGNLSGDTYRWTMDGEISNIDLKALKLSETKADGSLSFNGKGTYEPASQSLSANLTVDDVTWNMPEGSIALSDINAELSATASATNLSLRNQDLHASLAVGCSLDSTITRFSSAADTLHKQFSRRVFDVSELHDILPQFDLTLNAGSQNAISEYLSQSGMSFKNLELTAGNDSTVNIDGSLYGFRTKTSRFDSIAVKAYQRDDQLLYKLTVNNKPGTFDSFAHVNLNGGISDNRASAFFEQRDIAGDTAFNLGLIASLDSSVVKLNFVPFMPVIDYKEWTLNHDNLVTYDLQTHMVDANLKMQNDENSSIQLYTEYPTGNVNDKELVLKIADLNLSNWLSVNPFAPPIKGSISSDLRFQGDQTMLNGKGTISLDDLYYGKERVGSFVTDMDIYTQPDSFVVVKVSLMVDSLKAITLTGVLNDTTAATPLNLELAMTRFPLKIANPFLPKGVAKLGGTLNGKMDVTGELSKPVLNGYINFDSTAVDVVMTGTPLTLPDTHIPVTDNVITFTDFTIKGANDNPLTINGTVDVSDMELPQMQLDLKARNMQVIGSNKSKNIDVYGKGFIDFDATVDGNTSFLDIDASVDLLAGSNITYRMLEEANELKSRKTDDMVRFVQFSDTTHTEDADTVAASELLMAINALMKISEGATINVELSADGKNKVQLQGEGSLNYTMSPIMAESRLTGRYTINKGYVRYTPPLMSEKLFNFKENSYVAFNGDMLNPTLSLYADDIIKTNVTQEGANSRLVNFDVSISVTNTLNDMNVVFDLATNDDITVANELSSMSAEQRANQAMNLLLYNVYTGTNTKGDANLSENVLFSFLESQVNTWAANNIKFIDISFGIDQYNRTIDGNTSTTMSYSYQVSKSLFNDRIKIAIGGSYSTDTEDEDIAQNLLNDISFEYLLNRSGTMSIKLFRHTGYESILEGEITKTGVGFVYKRKIRSLADMFRFGKKLPNFNDTEPSTEATTEPSEPSEHSEPTQPSTEPIEATDEQKL